MNSNKLNKNIANSPKTLDKSNLFIFHAAQHFALHGELPNIETDKVFMTPVIVWEKVAFFYKNRDILERYVQMDLGDLKQLGKFMLPFYVKDGQAVTKNRDFFVLDGEQLKKVFPDLDTSLLLSVAQLESFSNIKFVQNAFEIDEEAFLNSANMHLQRCNEMIKIISKLARKKFPKVKPRKIRGVKPEKFISAKAKGVGFGSANYIKYKHKSLMIDFGGLNYSARDFSDFTMDSKQNYILLTHWHIDHYCNYSYLNFSDNNKPKYFIAPTEFYGLAELHVIFKMADVVQKVYLLPMRANYGKKPLMIIDKSIFIYGSNYADAHYEKTKYGIQMFLDFNSACLFAVNPIAKGIINLYAGDQKYDYIAPALENFDQKFFIKSIDLMHATHHGLLATPINNGNEPVVLRVNNSELKGNTAIVSNDFLTFKQNKQHKQFLDNNFKQTLITHYEDIITVYEEHQDFCQVKTK